MKREFDWISAIFVLCFVLFTVIFILAVFVIVIGVHEISIHGLKGIIEGIWEGWK